MLDGYRVVCVTPAGRRRYLKILVPYVLASREIDEYHLWLNTIEEEDLQYLHKLKHDFPQIRLVEPPAVVPSNDVFKGIPQFFRYCVEADTIYIRMDDDIVYMEPDFVHKLLRFRIDNPEYFLIFPNIINNALCSYIQAKRKAIIADAPIYPWCMDRVAWLNARFAEELHRSFLRSVANGQVEWWYFGVRILAFTWFSINCMSWFGRDFRHFGGEVVGNEEEFLTIVKPSEMGRVNCIYGDAIVSHFAFYVQRSHLDSTDLLARYASLQERNERMPTASHSGDRNVWTDRLLRALKMINEASISELTSAEYLANAIRYAGLAFDRRYPFGADNAFMNVGPSGLRQVPEQLANCLIQLRHYRIRTVLECGTGSGWTTAIVTAYLRHFNKNITVTTIDKEQSFSAYASIKNALPIDYRTGTTAADLATLTFDVVFIGNRDSSYDTCRSEYLAVGANASICVFQNINDKHEEYYDPNCGGIARLWRELSSDLESAHSVFQFTDHPAGQAVVGIGVLVRSSQVVAENDECERSSTTEQRSNGCSMQE